MTEAFTDADLKMFKDKMDESNKSGAYVALEKTSPWLPALLARLEAAEEVIKYLVHIPDVYEQKSGGCNHCRAVKAWIKDRPILHSDGSIPSDQTNFAPPRRKTWFLCGT